MSKLFTPLFLCSILISILLVGCSNEVADKGKVIVTINKEQIGLIKFEKELSLRSRQNPNFKVTAQAIRQQLDSIIDRQLMVQEAMKMGLTNNEDFVRTIQIFWEQTLIRELIEAKGHEWEDRLFVTEQDVNEYYDRISKEAPGLPPLEKIYDQVKKGILEEKKIKALESWLDEVREKSAIDINEDLIDSYLASENKGVQDGGADVR